MAEHVSTLRPRLVVAGAAAAIEYWTQVFGAREVERYTAPDGSIVHAELAIGDSRIATKDEDDADRAPSSLGGTPVLLMLDVDDVDALGERMVDAGGTVVYPIADREGESRGGRLRDPFGHEWMISQRATPNPS
jgi:PhnB protein